LSHLNIGVEMYAGNKRKEPIYMVKCKLTLFGTINRTVCVD
jgi:hypothetical protein